MQKGSPTIADSLDAIRVPEFSWPHLLKRIAPSVILDQAGSSFALFGAGLSATLFALRVVGRVDRGLLLWPVTGMVLALLLPRFNQSWKRNASLISTAALGIFFGGLIVGQPCWLAAIIAALTCLDLIVAKTFLSPYVRTFDDLKTHSNMLRFLATAVCAPVLSGLLGAFPVSLFLRQPYWQTASMSTLANSLGIAVVLPTILFLATAEFRGWSTFALCARKTALPAFFFIFVATLVFWQSKGPFLFVVFPPMIVVLLALGLEGAVLTSLTLTTIGWIATSHGHGPIMLMQTATPGFRLLVLQLFIWVSIATAIPVGALLDERKRAEKLAEESQSIYRILLQNTTDTIVLSSLDGSRRYVSPAITKLTGWTPEQYSAMDRRDTVHPDDRDLVPLLQDSLAEGKREHTVRYRLMQKDGSWKWVEATVQAYGTEVIAGYVGTIRDISEIKQTEDSWQQELHLLTTEKQRMTALAQTDSLTGVLNRRGLEESLLQQQSIRRGRLAVIMIDVDFFKLYNDTQGHQAGDQCLIRLADVLRTQAARSGDLVARLGGEEFAVVLPGADATGGLLVAEAIQATLAAIAIPHPATALGRVSISMGVAATPPSQDTNINLLLAQADRALYASKRNGKNRATGYESRLELVSA